MTPLASHTLYTLLCLRCTPSVHERMHAREGVLLVSVGSCRVGGWC